MAEIPVDASETMDWRDVVVGVAASVEDAVAAGKDIASERIGPPVFAAARLAVGAVANSVPTAVENPEMASAASAVGAVPGAAGAAGTPGMAVKA